MTVPAVSSNNSYQGFFPWVKLQIRLLPLRIQNVIRKIFHFLQMLYARIFGNLPGEIGRLHDQIQVLEKGYLSGYTVKRIFQDIERKHPEGATYIYTLYGKSEELKKHFLTRYWNYIFHFLSFYEDKGKLAIEIQGYEHISVFIAKYLEKRKNELGGVPQYYSPINWRLDIERLIFYGSGSLSCYLLRNYWKQVFNPLWNHTSFSGTLIFLSGITVGMILFSFCKKNSKHKG